MPRPILLSAITDRRGTERISISAPGDFVRNHTSATADAARDTYLPYCLDFAWRRAVYVGGVDAAGAQAAPFYYLHLRRNARTVLSVPWENGALALVVQRAPVFLFSPGRCGSTLLSRILSKAGCANVSEPDFYTQATSAFWSSPLNPLRATVRDVVANMGSDLAATLSPDRSPVVKLRAESCRAPGMLLQPRERRTLFMTRSFEAWARSNERAFRNGARKSVGKYLRALRCYAELKRSSDCHVVRHEDLTADPLAAARALGAHLGRPLDAAAVLAAMTEDSQKGTPLAQGARPGRPGWERRFDETMALWNSARVRQVRDRLDVYELETG